MDKPRHQEQAATIALAPDKDAAGNDLDWGAYVDLLVANAKAKGKPYEEFGQGKTKQFYGTKEGYGKYVYQMFGKGNLSLVPLVGGGTAKTATDLVNDLVPTPEQVPASEKGVQDFKTPQQRRQIARARIAGGGVRAPTEGGTATVSLLGGGA